jgi:ABC-type multidrug transport system fused ATPase/permease subunit
MKVKNNNIYLLNKLSQKENKSLRNSYEKEIKFLRDEIEKENKSLKDKYEKEIKSSSDDCEQEIKHLNHEYEEEIKSLNDKYEKEIKSTDKYDEWLSDLFRWNLSTVLTLNSIIILLYLVSVYSTNNNPVAMLCIYAFMYFFSIIFISITISLNKKFSFLLYLKAKIIYLFSYFHLFH